MEDVALDPSDEGTATIQLSGRVAEYALEGESEADTRRRLLQYRGHLLPPGMLHHLLTLPDDQVTDRPRALRVLLRRKAYVLTVEAFEVIVAYYDSCYGNTTLGGRLALAKVLLRFWFGFHGLLPGCHQVLWNFLYGVRPVGVHVGPMNDVEAPARGPEAPLAVPHNELVRRNRLPQQNFDRVFRHNGEMHPVLRLLWDLTAVIFEV